MKKLLLALVALTSPLSAKEAPAPTTNLTAVTTEMATAANALIGSLDAAQVKQLRFPFDAAQRENWGYVPRQRKGLPLTALGDKQIALVRALLKTALSDPGLAKADAIMALETFLGEMEKRPDFRNPKNYYASIFGDPKPGGTWSWRFEGHHLSLNFTIIDGKAVSVTPSFMGANPAEITGDNKLKGNRPLAAEEDLARTLAATLKESGKAVVFSEKPPGEILTGQDRAVKQLVPVGVPASEMTATQQTALIGLVTEFANRHRKELAETDLAKIKSDLKNLQFGWAGGLKRGDPYYYRIQGTTFLVEVANVQNHGNHIHTVWRDSSNDFGRDLLGKHIGHEH